MTEELPLQLLSRARSAVAALAVLAVTLTAAVVGLAAPASAEPAGPTPFPTVTAPSSTIGTVRWKVSDQIAAHLATRELAGGATDSAGEMSFPVTDVATTAGTTTVTTSGVARLSFVNRGTTYYWLQLADLRVVTDGAGAGAVTADVSAWVMSFGGAPEIVVDPVRVDVATLTAPGIARGASVSSSAQAFTDAFVDALPTSMQPHVNGSTPAKLAAPVTVSLDPLPTPPGPPAFPTVPAPATTLGSVTWAVSDQVAAHLSTREITGGASAAGGVFAFPVTSADGSESTTTVTTSGVVRLSFVNRGTAYYWLQLADLRVVVGGGGAGTVSAEISAWVAPFGGASEIIVDPVRVDVATVTAAGVARGATVTSTAQAFTDAFVAALPASMRPHFNGSTAAKLAAPVTVALDAVTSEPTDEPTDGSTGTPTDKPTDKPTDEPSGEPSDEPTDTSTSTPPSCTVDDTVASSSLAWGIKKSFVDYLTGPIAGGKVTRTGVGLEDGRFVWSKGTGTATLGRASVAFPGSLRLTGHHDELDMTLSDVRLVVTSATRGEIRVDASIRAYLGNPAQRLDDVVVGTVDLTGAVTTSGATTRIVNAPVTLTASGVPVFASFYKAGDALEPVSATLTVTETCDVPGTDEPGTDTPTTTPAPRVTIGGDADGTAVEQGGTVTFTTTGLPASASTSAEVRSDPVRLGTRRASARGSVTYTFKVPASFPTGRHTFVLTAAGVEGSVKRSFRVVAASEPTTAPSDEPTAEPSDTATTSDAPACTARVVAGATLSWAIKDSFVSYIEGTIAQGSIATSGARRSGGKFTWSGGSGALNTVDSRGTVRFAGSVTTSGHDGKLEVRFANPRVVVAGSTGYLVLDVAGTTLEGEDFAYTGLTFATLALAGHGGTSGDRIAYSGVPATLTAAGAKAFSGFYEAGEQLAPVAFTLPLGAETDCTPDSGTLPTTGAETAGLGGVAAAFVVLGLGFVALQRRRARLEA